MPLEPWRLIACSEYLKIKNLQEILGAPNARGKCPTMSVPEAIDRLYQIKLALG